MPASKNPLLVPELLCIVLEFLAGPNKVGLSFATPDRETQRALAVLARTCKAFTGPALDFLWRRLSSLEPLVRCFASWYVLENKPFLRHPSQAQWVIIRQYASRIRKLQVHDDRSSFLLEYAMFEQNLFPNLRALKWNARPDTHPIGISLIQPLLGPRLVVLDFGAYSYDVELVSFLKACPSRCPLLTAVRFVVRVPGWSELTDIYSEALCNFENLKAVDIRTLINNSALHHFLMSPQLQELTARIWPNQLERFSPSPSAIPLRNIKTLDLTLSSLRPFTELLLPGAQRFCEVFLHLLWLECAASIQSLFSGLASPMHTSHLKMFSICSTATNFRFEDSPIVAVSFNILRLLTCHTNLRQLTIKIENPIHLDDEELVELARNWPLLQTIRICYVPRSPPPTKYMTFKGLLSLISACPDLRDVGLTLDGREVPSGGGVEAGSGSRMITKLRFPNSPINNQPGLVTKFLLRNFPSLTNVYELGALLSDPVSAFDRYSRQWARVQMYIVHPSKLESAGGNGDEV